MRIQIYKLSSETDKRFVALTLNILIISNMFGQKDLADKTRKIKNS
jgi:hypothetical protein